MFQVEKNKTLYIINNEIIGEVDYSYINKDTVNITHTYVSPLYRGKGIAEKMLEKIFKYIKDHNLKVICTCSYAEKWFQKHEEYQDLKVSK